MSAAFAYQEMRECFEGFRDRSKDPLNRDAFNRLARAIALLVAANDTRSDISIPLPSVLNSSVVTPSQADRDRAIEWLKGINDNLEGHSREFVVTRRDHHREDS